MKFVISSLLSVAPCESNVSSVFFWAFRDAEAFSDVLSWSCHAYNAFVGGQDGGKEEFERSLAGLYPPLDNIHESEPATVADKRGVITLYYVPNALQRHRQVGTVLRNSRCLSHRL